MKNTKRRMEVFSFFDHTGISAHLENMAQKGWMIEKITTFGWRYRRIEPQKVKFAVSYYPKASEFDPEPSEEQKIFHEFCAHTGWKLACTSAQLQIFYNERKNPTPIETEPVLELQTIHASVKRGMLPSYLLLMLVAVLNARLFISRLLGDPIDLLASPSGLFSGFTVIWLALLCAVELVTYFKWYSKAKVAAEQGEFLKAPSTAKFQKVVLVIVGIALIYWAVNYLFRSSDVYLCSALNRDRKCDKRIPEEKKGIFESQFCSNDRCRFYLCIWSHGSHHVWRTKSIQYGAFCRKRRRDI